MLIMKITKSDNAGYKSEHVTKQMALFYLPSVKDHQIDFK